jgi:hypothetical protein
MASGSRAGLIERLRRWLPGVWAGILLCLATLATPAIFATLERADAGRVVGRIFVQDAWMSLGLAALLLVIERVRARAAAAAGQGSVLSTEMLMLLGTVFCTVAGYFAIQPLMPAARAGQGPVSFGQLHAASSVLFGIKLVLLVMLAWRASGPQAISRLPSS